MRNYVTVNWQPLPSGQDILIREGLLYAVVGMVDVPQAKLLPRADQPRIARATAP